MGRLGLDAVDYAILLALIEHLSLCLLHVVSGPSRSRDDVTVMEGRHLLARGETRAADAGVTTKPSWPSVMWRTRSSRPPRKSSVTVLSWEGGASRGGNG